jgi:type IV pilus assembly protein PilB
MAKRKKLGEILVDAGVITNDQLSEALEDQKRYGGRLGTILLDRRYISEKTYLNALTSQLKIPAIDLAKSTIPESVIKVLPPDLAEKLVVFPIAVKRTPMGNILVLAMADPTNVEAQDEVRFTTGYKVEVALALESTLRYAIRDYFYNQNGKGSYKLDMDDNTIMDEKEARIQTMDDMRPEQEVKGDDDFIVQAEDDSETFSDDKPVLTRELKTLLKLLSKKGVITSKEYLEAFKETK